MKIRSGFVSNSSSSSFLAIVSKKDWENLVSSLTAIERAVLRYIDTRTLNFLGTECISISYITGNYSSFEGVSKSEVFQVAKSISSSENISLGGIEEDDYYAGDIVYSVQEKINKLESEGKAIVHSDYF